MKVTPMSGGESKSSPIVCFVRSQFALRNRLVDYPLIVRGDDIPRIQDVQASIYHVLRLALGDDHVS